MSYKVAIRKNSTSEIRIVPFDHGDFSLYMWTDGNWACDCNRADFFGDEDAGNCGSTRFTALYAEMADGTRVEIDDEPDATV